MKCILKKNDSFQTLKSIEQFSLNASFTNYWDVVSIQNLVFSSLLSV